jgi:hypothetical protein
VPPPPPSVPKIAAGVASVRPRQPAPQSNGYGDPAYLSQTEYGYGYPAPHPGLGQPLAPMPIAGGPPGRPGAQGRALPLRRRGPGWTKVAVIITAACWLLWLGTTAVVPNGDLSEPIVAAVIVAAGAVGVYWLTRLGGYLIRSSFERGPRRGTFLPHLLSAIFLVLCAFGFFTRARYNFGDVVDWFSNLLPF